MTVPQQTARKQAQTKTLNICAVLKKQAQGSHHAALAWNLAHAIPSAVATELIATKVIRPTVVTQNLAIIRLIGEIIIAIQKQPFTIKTSKL